MLSLGAKKESFATAYKAVIHLLIKLEQQPTLEDQEPRPRTVHTSQIKIKTREIG